MERIKTSYGTFTVYLNRIVSSEGNLYHLSFVDNHNKAQVAILKRSGGGWGFVDEDKLPDWIVSLKAPFETLISKELFSEHLAVTT
ncbi:MAG: hypothetical protein ACXVBX_14170 [Flavisolibacter sp.]